MNGYFALVGEEKVDKRHPVIMKMKTLVDEQYANGRNTVMGDIELEEMLQDIDFDFYRQLAHIHVHKNK